MKKLLSLILCLVLCLSLFACDTQEDQPTATTATTQTTENGELSNNNTDAEDKTVCLSEFLKTEGLKRVFIEMYDADNRIIEYEPYKNIGQIITLFSYMEKLVLTPRDDKMSRGLLNYSFEYVDGEVIHINISRMSLGILNGDPDTCSYIWYDIVYDEMDDQKSPYWLFEELYKLYEESFERIEYTTGEKIPGVVIPDLSSFKKVNITMVDKKIVFPGEIVCATLSLLDYVYPSDNPFDDYALRNTTIMLHTFYDLKAAFKNLVLLDESEIENNIHHVGDPYCVTIFFDNYTYIDMSVSSYGTYVTGSFGSDEECINYIPETQQQATDILKAFNLKT